MVCPTSERNVVDVCLIVSWEGLRSALNDDEKISRFTYLCMMHPRSHGSLCVLQVGTGLICHRTGQQSPHWLTWMPGAFLLPSCRSPSQAWTLGNCRKLPGRRERCCPHPHECPCPCDSHSVKMTAVLREELRHHTCRGRCCLQCPPSLRFLCSSNSYFCEYSSHLLTGAASFLWPHETSASPEFHDILSQQEHLSQSTTMPTTNLPVSTCQ